MIAVIIACGQYRRFVPKIERFPESVNSKVKRAEPMASHSARRFCGRRFVGLGFDLFVFILFSGNGGVVFESVTAPGHGSGLGVVQETI
jgi:hypothetical protein